jgi:hypothetical protein
MYDPEVSIIAAEFMALANHNPRIMEEVARYSVVARDMEVAAFSRWLGPVRIAAGDPPPAAISILLSSLSMFLSREHSFGVSTGHAETLEFLERWLFALEPD